MNIALNYQSEQDDYDSCNMQPTCEKQKKVSNQASRQDNQKVDFNVKLTNYKQKETATQQLLKGQEELTCILQVSEKTVEQPNQEVIQTKKKEALTPEIDWEADTVAREGMNGLVNAVSPASNFGKK